MKSPPNLPSALEDRATIAASLGSQALICEFRGQLERAMELLDKAAGIWIALEDQRGLRVCLGSRALIRISCMRRRRIRAVVGGLLDAAEGMIWPTNLGRWDTLRYPRIADGSWHGGSSSEGHGQASPTPRCTRNGRSIVDRLRGAPIRHT